MHIPSVLVRRTWIPTEKYAPLEVAQAWMRLGVGPGPRQAYILLSRVFDKPQRQHYISPKDSIVRLTSIALDHLFHRHIWRGSSSKFVTKTTGLGVGSTSFWLGETSRAFTFVRDHSIQRNLEMTRGGMWD